MRSPPRTSRRLPFRISPTCATKDQHTRLDPGGPDGDGFRSSFRDWAAERTETPHAVMEAALAHAVRNATERAYARSDLFERRRVMMQQWADYLGETA